MTKICDERYTTFKFFIVILCVMNFIVFSGIMNKIPGVEKINYTCLISCQGDTCKDIVKKSRDENYWLEPKGVKVDKNCLFSAWEMTHFIFHIALGYEYGFIISLYFSVMFEIYENVIFSCGSLLDIGWNAIGGLIGMYLKKYFSNCKL